MLKCWHFGVFFSFFTMMDSVCHAQVIGRSLSPVFKAHISDSAGYTILKYLPGAKKWENCMVGVLLVVWPPLGRIRYSSGPGHLYWSTNAGCNMRCLVRTRKRLTGSCLSLVEWFGIWSSGMAMSHYVMLCCSFCTVTQILPDKSTYSP
jgi:hypothetical protein